MPNLSASPVLCIGGAHVDRLGRTYGSPILGTSNPGRVLREKGGVARNVAENLARLGCPVSLMSRVGKDEDGQTVLDHAAALGIDTSLVTVSEECQTGSYTAFIGDDGEMVIALADMDIYREMNVALIETMLPKLRKFPYWFIDSNLGAAPLEALLQGAGPSKVCVGAVSSPKVQRLQPLLGRFSYLFANVKEGAGLAGLPQDVDHDPALVGAALKAKGCEAGVLTASHGRVVVWADGVLSTLPVIKARAQDVTGAGDSLAAGTIFGLLKGLSLPAAVQWGLAAASVTIESPHTVSHRISQGTLEARLKQES